MKPYFQDISSLILAQHRQERGAFQYRGRMGLEPGKHWEEYLAADALFTLRLPLTEKWLPAARESVTAPQNLHFLTQKPYGLYFLLVKVFD